MPGVALGSEVLLHAERATATFAIAVAILSVLAQAARGRLPTQLSTAGLAYDVAAATDTARAVDEVQDQVHKLEAAVRHLNRFSWTAGSLRDRLYSMMTPQEKAALRAEAREHWRIVEQENAKSRERVLQAVANLREIAEKKRELERRSRFRWW